MHCWRKKLFNPNFLQFIYTLALHLYVFTHWDKDTHICISKLSYLCRLFGVKLLMMNAIWGNWTYYTEHGLEPSFRYGCSFPEKNIFLIRYVTSNSIQLVRYQPLEYVAGHFLYYDLKEINQSDCMILLYIYVTFFRYVEHHIMIRNISNKYTLKNVIIGVICISEYIVYESGSSYCFSGWFENHRQ